MRFKGYRNLAEVLSECAACYAGSLFTIVRHCRILDREVI